MSKNRDERAGLRRGSPKSREEHMARRAAHQTQRATGSEFGVAQSTVSRGYRKLGRAK